MSIRKRGELLGKFIILATYAHAGQLDKGGEPYILHVLKVLDNLRDLFGKEVDEELECIALGHDLFEDTKITEEDIWKIGGTDRIVRGISDLTKRSTQSYDQYIETVLNNIDAMRVKMADLEHNLEIKRLKKITDKDIARMGKYMSFFTLIKQKLERIE